VDAIPIYLRMLGKDERGATAIEYGLIAALIAVTCIGGFKALGGGAGGMWADIAAKFAGAMA
jgi:pilus assembly protein Flp/PilA